MIHDIYAVSTEEMQGDDGNIHEVEVEKVIEEDVESKVYIELADVRTILPFYTTKGVHMKDRSIVKANGDNYVIKGTFEELSSLKNKTRTITGFNNGKEKQV